MKKSTFLFLIAVLLLSLSGIAHAASPWTEGKTYQEKVLGKLDFGFKNLLGGWTELFTETGKGEPSCKCKIQSTARGIGRGIAYAAADTIGGALHILTFPFPQVDVPLPENGVHLG